MKVNTNDYVVGFGAVAWLIAGLSGPGFINPFAWWLSFKEALEVFVYLLGGGNIGAIIAAYPSPETIAIVGGWIGIVAWISLGIAFARDQARVSFVLNFLFVPVLGLIAAGKYVLDRRAEEPESASADPA